MSMEMMMRLCCCLNANVQVTPPHPRAHTPHHQPTLLANVPIATATGRRNAVFLSVISSLICRTPPSLALSFGIPGPKEWLKDQKKKSSSFLLAPINASRQNLRTAFALLTAVDSGTGTDNREQLHTLLKSAARDCVPQQRNPFVTFQAQTGVEVCTFRLILNNASSLLGNKDPVKLEAEAMLDDLIRSFTFLDDAVNKSNLQLTSDRLKLEDCLMETMTSIDKFEKVIKDCLNAVLL